VNPSLITVRGQVGYQTNTELAFFIAGDQAIWGKNSPAGLNISAGLEMRIGKTEVPGGRDAVSDLDALKHGFVRYGIEAQVLRANDRLNLVKINKGSTDGVAVGQTFDIFSLRPDGKTGDVVARGKISAVHDSEAAITVTEYYLEVWIDEGFVVRRVLD
jgi:hypothetical protein